MNKIGVAWKLALGLAAGVAVVGIAYTTNRGAPEGAAVAVGETRQRTPLEILVGRRGHRPLGRQAAGLPHGAAQHPTDGSNAEAPNQPAVPNNMDRSAAIPPRDDDAEVPAVPNDHDIGSPPIAAGVDSDPPGPQQPAQQSRDQPAR